ncbi:hypothetical protein [Pelagibacterium luteolum]|uniref:Uncharacterized protein n=1 Tax=Pelagibacterium luteolum TaxID=440168 RepID=A0A1G7TK46_9HYPH|nr:hypothetical protein [Pelagibacterium luteolum]SDG35581.1 hypothetical protein SAMN04487974_102175 [Pelagibacterium luteolum]
MKFTPSETTLIELISAMPGRSYCPDADEPLNREAARLLRRLESKALSALSLLTAGFGTR